MSYICTDFSLEENWSFGEHRLAYDFSSATDDTVTIGFSGSAWISPLSNSWNLPTRFNLSRRNDTTRINSTPRAITSPVIRIQEGCNHTIAVAVNDPDGDIIRCRWAVGTAECGGICNQFPGAELDPVSCVISYHANRGARFWAAALMIEDFLPGSSQPLSSVALQFLVLVIHSSGPCSQRPTFIPPTIRHGNCVAIPPQSTFETQLTADSGGSGASIVEIQTTSPLGTRKGHIMDSTYSNVSITWTPDESQQNQTHLFCYTAVNSIGLASEQTCIQLLPGHTPPAPVQGTATPNRQLVHPSNTTWQIRFDTDIERASIAAFITFHASDTEREVCRIDASLSQEVLFTQSNQIFITPNCAFEEKKRFYINFERSVVQGLEGCGPGNDPIEDSDFWTFETLDVTAPTITFLENRRVSNSNITLSWESNEEARWQCKLVKDGVVSIVNCSEAYWKGYALSGGSYDLQINATDLSGNTATVVHTFEIDLIPPITSIVLKPARLSNQQTPTFTFACNEICVYVCKLLPSQGTSPCNQGIYRTPSLQHGGNYTFVVTVMDQVGNEGLPVAYSWETDFESPQVFGVRDVSVPCVETGPQYAGQAEATDNRPEAVSVTYNDANHGCSIRRTWSARDEAGNTAHLVQNIELEFSPTVSLLPRVSSSCDSTAGSITVPTGTASAPNPCRLPIQLTHVDSISAYTCPDEFSRNWTVSSCGRSAHISQTIVLYDLCPPHACGRNESSPHGICSLGECRCNRPWHGLDCRTLIYEPSVQSVNDTILREAEMYAEVVTLILGTPPLSWTLLSGPNQLRLDLDTSTVVWNRAQAGNYSISVQIENEVGSAVVEWILQVKAGYSAVIDRVSPTLYPQAQPVTLTGYVEYVSSNLVEGFLVGIVPVNIDVISNGVARTMTTFTSKDGQFSHVFYPAATEYGSYTAGARHPSSLESMPQTEWGFLGMRAIPRVITLRGEAVNEFEETFYNETVICNDGPGTLSGLTATPTSDTRDLNVQIMLRGLLPNGTLEQRVKLTMDIHIAMPRPQNRVFSIQLSTIEGTMLQLFVSIQVDRILPAFLISPPSLNTRIVRGRSRVFEFNITNIGRAEATNVRSRHRNYLICQLRKPRTV